MSEAEENSPQAGKKQFGIQKIYVKDMSFETPNSPNIFTQDWKPDINLELTSQAHKITGEMHEVVLSLTVTAKLGNNTAYLAEVQQAGIFALQGFTEEELAPMLGAVCPGTLFPYARETVTDLVSRGGFPQLLLAAINFESLYVEQTRAAKAHAAEQQMAQH